MTLTKAGGWAALTCAATYLFGFALLLTVLAPLGYGSTQIDGPAVVAFIRTSPGLMILWHSVIYILNAFALAVLVAAVGGTAPGAPLLRGLGFVWVTLVLGAGMIANVTVEQVVSQDSLAQARALWQVLHAVELGLGGGNEIAGAVWIGAVSLTVAMGRVTRLLGGAVGLSGVATLSPQLGDGAGALFGLGAILWFVLVGLHLLRVRA